MTQTQRHILVCLRRERWRGIRPRMPREVKEWEQVWVGSLLRAARRGLSVWSGEGREKGDKRKQGRDWGEASPDEPTPTFSIYNTSSFLLLWVNPASPNIKCSLRNVPKE